MEHLIGEAVKLHCRSSHDGRRTLRNPPHYTPVMMASTLRLLIILLMVFVQLPIETTLPQPRLLKRSRKRCDRTRLATLNCRTLLADESLDDLDASLIENGISICALQETRSDGLLSTYTDNYKIFWYGECCGHRGVGFAVHKKYVNLVSAVRGFPGSDGRIMSMDILLHDAKYPVTLICAYSPPNTRKHAKTRETFYSQLRSISTNKTWLLGDFNARVGRRITDTSGDHDHGIAASDTVGPWSLKGDLTPNVNGALLLDIASENGLRHVHSHFSCKDSKRWSWRHPRYRTRALLDHIFVPSTSMRFVSRAFVAAHTTIFTDHRLVVCELTFRPRFKKSTPRRPTLVDNRALNCHDVRNEFQATISDTLNKIDPYLQSTDDISNMIRSVPVSAAKAILPVKSKSKFPDEFSKDTVNLILRKRKLWKFIHKSGQRITRSMQDTYRSLCRETKKSVSEDRIATLEKEARELDDAFKVDRFKGYRLLKRQHRTRTKAVMPPEADFTKHYLTTTNWEMRNRSKLLAVHFPHLHLMTLYHAMSLTVAFVV